METEISPKLKPLTVVRGEEVFHQLSLTITAKTDNEQKVLQEIIDELNGRDGDIYSILSGYLSRSRSGD